MTPTEYNLLKEFERNFSSVNVEKFHEFLITLLLRQSDVLCQSC